MKEKGKAEKSDWASRRSGKTEAEGILGAAVQALDGGFLATGEGIRK